MSSRIHTIFEIYDKYGLHAALTSSAQYTNADALYRWCLKRFWQFDLDSDYELKLISADVEKITHTQDFPFSIRSDNAVVGMGEGDWDMMATEFTQSRIYRSLELRFVEGKPWEQTPAYRQAKHDINNGVKSWNSCRSMEELRERCEQIDRLYNSMESNGYRSRLDEERSKGVRNVRVPDRIRLAVARDGHFIRCASARHRLAIAKLLDIETIPAIVQIEHRDWDEELEIQSCIRL